MADNDLGKKLKETRQNARMTQRQLAKLSGVPYVTICRIETGATKEPMTSTINKLFGALSTDVTDAVASESETHIDIPRLDVSASAGMGMMFQDDAVVEMMRISSAWLESHVAAPHNHLAIITARGDSMEPTFRDGDLLLVDTSANSANVDAIFVFTAEGQLYVKRIQRTPGKLTAISDNTRYAPFQLDASTEGLRFLGRVVYFWRGDKA